MIKQKYNEEYNKDEYYKRKVKQTAYIFQQSKLSSRIYFDLLKRIYNRSGYNWSLISIQFRNEDYIWWSYITYQENPKLRRFIDILEMQACDHGCPQNIIKIVEIINMNCYFNHRIRYFFTLMSWAHNILYTTTGTIDIEKTTDYLAKKNILIQKTVINCISLAICTIDSTLEQD